MDSIGCISTFFYTYRCVIKIIKQKEVINLGWDIRWDTRGAREKKGKGEILQLYFNLKYK